MRAAAERQGRKILPEWAGTGQRAGRPTGYLPFGPLSPGGNTGYGN
jgi:hypothetical protein